MTSYSGWGTAGSDFRPAGWQGSCSARWRPFEIAAIVVGFAFWWPVGLAMLGFKLARGRRVDWSEAYARAQGAVSGMMAGRARPRTWQPFATGNSAFDDWRQAEIDRLEEERRQLDAAQKEFGEHLANLRRARDREEFDSFMAARRKPTGEPNG